MIAKECQKHGRGFIFPSDASKGCNYIDNLLKKLEQEEEGTIRDVGGVFAGWIPALVQQGNIEKMKNAIRPILANESDETKYKEYHEVEKAADLARAEYKARLQRAASAAETKKREEKENPKF